MNVAVGKLSFTGLRHILRKSSLSRLLVDIKSNLLFISTSSLFCFSLPSLHITQLAQYVKGMSYIYIVHTGFGSLKKNIYLFERQRYREQESQRNHSCAGLLPGAFTQGALNAGTQVPGPFSAVPLGCISMDLDRKWSN